MTRFPALMTSSGPRTRQLSAPLPWPRQFKFWRARAPQPLPLEQRHIRRPLVRRRRPCPRPRPKRQHMRRHMMWPLARRCRFADPFCHVSDLGKSVSVTLPGGWIEHRTLPVCRPMPLCRSDSRVHSAQNAGAVRRAEYAVEGSTAAATLLREQRDTAARAVRLGPLGRRVAGLMPA